MRRVLRILTSAAAVLSLVLCAATMAAWVRSYRTSDLASWTRGDHRLEVKIDTYRGGLSTSVIRAKSYLSTRTGWWPYAPVSYDQSRGSKRAPLNQFGFALDYFENSEYAMRSLACPYWFIMLLTTILPLARLALGRRRARRLGMHPNLCRHCGYDCRATPDRCPECGTVPTPQPARPGGAGG